jgi:hypothetical protein
MQTTNLGRKFGANVKLFCIKNGGIKTKSDIGYKIYIHILSIAQSIRNL